MKRIYYLCSALCLISAAMAHASMSWSPKSSASPIESTKSTPFFLSSTVSQSSDDTTLLAAVNFVGKKDSTSFKSTNSTSCSAGYIFYGGKCVKDCDRTVYPFAYKPDTSKGTLASCAGTATFYGYSKCNTGWTLRSEERRVGKECL